MQDIFKQQADWLKTWQEKQETLTKQYVGLSEEWTKNILGGKKREPDFFEGWFNSQGDLENQFKEFGKRMNEMLSNVWGNKIPSDVLKFVNTSFFEEFYRNWLSSIELPGGIKNPLGMDGGLQQATNFLRSFMEKENPLFSAFGSTNITGQMSRVFGMLQGTLGNEGSALSDIVSNYQNLFSKLFDSASNQGTEKLAEGFETWAIEIGKQLSAPKLGINRELAHDISQALVLSQHYAKAYVKMTRLVEETSRKAGIRFQSKLSEAAIKNKPVNKFGDYCSLWASENEAAFLEVLGTKEFARLQGDYLDAGHRLKIQWNKLAEKALESTPIALKRDLDLAIAEIQQMKRDMRTFKRELLAVQKEMLVARGALAAAEEESKNAKNAVKAAEAAAKDELKKAKALVKDAEIAAQDEAKKAKVAEAAMAELTKRVTTVSKTEKVIPKAIAKTKSKKV